MIGDPHLAQLIGHRHGDQMGTPLPTHPSGVRGHCLFRVAVFSSGSGGMMVIRWLQRFTLQNLKTLNNLYIISV
jgi:hypothetical protein